MVREGGDETIWSRLHARQAFIFGFLASFALLVVLALPLLTVILIPTISAAATITVYTVGLIGDVIAGAALILIAVRYSARAARGELFAIPLVTPIVDRCFRLRAP